MLTHCGSCFLQTLNQLGHKVWWGGVGLGWVAVIIEESLRLIITPLMLLEFGLQALVKYINIC